LLGCGDGAREVAGQISRPCASGRETAAASPASWSFVFWEDEVAGRRATGSGAVGRGPWRRQCESNPKQPFGANFQ